MKKIMVAYWHLSKFPDLEYEHKQEFDYSKEKRNEIIDRILDAGYSVMLRPHYEEGILIWIDKGRFGQK